MSAHWLDRTWNYVNAEDTLKPNYLRNRFKAIRREQKEAADRAKQAAPTPITKARKKA